MSRVELTRQEMEDLSCWFPRTDRVANQPEVTNFKQRARVHQAQWRDSKNLDRGSHQDRGGNGIPNGSRLTSADGDALQNFLSDEIRAAVSHRLANKEQGQQLNPGRLRNDLLSSMPMCFNLFGELHQDPERTRGAAERLWGITGPDPVELKFEHSPGRHDLAYTGDGTAFDVAFVFGNGDVPGAIVGVETKYHEHATKEAAPKDNRLPRYREITEKSGVFRHGWEGEILGTELQQIWRDHLLVLAMLQNPDGQWASGKYVLVHPASNPSFAEAGKRYADVLDDTSTFAVRTIESLLDANVLHSQSTEKQFRERYLW